MKFRHKIVARGVMEVVQPAEEFALDPPVDGAAMESAAPLEEVFCAHHARIVGMLARVTGDRGAAEDIAGDVFCKLAERPPQGKSAAVVAAWLYRVAANAGFDALRRRSRRQRREEAATSEHLRLAERPGALEDVLRQERRTRVRAALADLKPRDAQLLLLRSGGMSYRELAEAVGVAPASVGTMLARAEAEFERRFRKRNGDWK
jgi:RNA polymerase sigma-70 factor, ECF subfamily